MFSPDPQQQSRVCHRGQTHVLHIVAAGIHYVERQAYTCPH